ncbi:MAG: hypothetical protein HRU15_14220 [Planctomycetes bacterium]|nr:hypothetical protein [Planctomycetota bacterium]
MFNRCIVVAIIIGFALMFFACVINISMGVLAPHSAIDSWTSWLLMPAILGTFY